MRGPLPGGIDVSRETSERLEKFADLIETWTRRINLIAPASISTLWNRHIADSAQLVLHAPEFPRSWSDLGSGAGLPGFVVAIIAAEKWPELRLTLIESDQRKAVFLRNASRELNLEVTLLVDRIENLPPLRSQVISARALAPLTALLTHAHRHLAYDGAALFPKGRNHANEVAEARRNWSFALATIPSLTDEEGRILRIERIERA